jgi:hypothetical protein
MEDGPPSPPMMTTLHLSLLPIQRRSPLPSRSMPSTALTSGEPSQPRTWKQRAWKTLLFKHRPRTPTLEMPSGGTARGSTSPPPPPKEVIDLTSPLSPPTTGRSPSYHIRTPMPATPHPPAHLRQLQWTPDTPDPHRAMLPNPLNSPFILPRSPTPPPRRARLLQIVALVDSNGNTQAFRTAFVPPNMWLLHTTHGIRLSSFPPL